MGVHWTVNYHMEIVYNLIDAVCGSFDVKFFQFTGIEQLSHALVSIRLGECFISIGD